MAGTIRENWFKIAEVTPNLGPVFSVDLRQVNGQNASRIAGELVEWLRGRQEAGVTNLMDAHFLGAGGQLLVFPVVVSHVDGYMRAFNTMGLADKPDGGGSMRLWTGENGERSWCIYEMHAPSVSYVAGNAAEQRSALESPRDKVPLKLLGFEYPEDGGGDEVL